MTEPEIDPLISRALEGLPSDFAGFDRVYADTLLPELSRLEASRSKAAAKAKQGFGYGAGIALIGAILGFFVFGVPPLGIVAILAGLATAGVMHSDLNKVSKKAKSMMVTPIAEEFNLNYTEAPGDLGSIYDFRQASLLGGWDRQKFEDHMTGSRNGTPFEFFEAHLEVKRVRHDAKGRTRTEWVTVFRGQCLRFQFQKEFLGRTLVARDAGFFDRFGNGHGMKVAKLEDPKFEKIFTVHTTDQVESRYLLTPDFMQRLVDLEEVFHGGGLTCAFKDGEILITVQGGDLFEPGSAFQPLDNPERIRELLDDFASVFHLIDSMSSQ